MQHEPSKVGFTIRALKEYDNPKMGNETTPVQSPRLTLLGEIAPIPPSQVHTLNTTFLLLHSTVSLLLVR